MTDTAIALEPSTAGVANAQTVIATSALFVPGDVGRQLTIRCDCPVRLSNTAYVSGAVFYAEYNSTDRVYRVTTGGTTDMLKAAGTTPDFDLTAPRLASDEVIDGTCRLKYLGAGRQAYGFGVITAVTSSTAVTVQVDPRGPFASTGASLRWALGDWSNTRGWPYAVTFYQQRTVWGGSATKPDTLWFSQSGDFENMGDREPDGTVLDTDAITLALDDDQVNTINWLTGIPRGLAVGVASGEFLVGPASTVNAAISPANIRALRQGDRGSTDIAGIRISGVVLFVQRGGRKLRQLEYDFATDSFTTQDLAQLSDHISGPGWVEMAYQEQPDGALWLVRSDGVLISLTFDREQKVRAWARHELGGIAQVESVCVVPSADGTGDDLYVACARPRPDGTTMRTIEFIRQPFRADLDGPNGGYFVDCGLSYNGIPQATFSGLDHLEGQNVAICADGARRPPQTVHAGSVTLQRPASIVHIGLPYTSILTTLQPEVPQGGSIQNKLKRLGDVTLRFLETRGGLLGSADRMQELQFRPRQAPMSEAEPLFTGDIRTPFPGGVERTGQMTVYQADPLPMTLLAVTYDLVTNA